jgi:hypothetical protein
MNYMIQLTTPGIDLFLTISKTYGAINAPIDCSLLVLQSDINSI